MNRISFDTAIKPLTTVLQTVGDTFDRSLQDKKPWQIVAGTIAIIGAFVILKNIANIDWKPKIALVALWWKAKKIAQERQDFRMELEQKLFADGVLSEELPPVGIPKDDLLATIHRADHTHWQNGKATGAVYHNRPEIKEVVMEALREYYSANPLHADLFPDVRKHEASIIRQICTLFNGNSDTCGAFDSGGTESIGLACLAARNRAKILYGITQPEIIAPTTVHAAFKKACHYFGIKLILVPVNHLTFEADVKAMEKAITKNTVLMVGSCISFPHGMVDSIKELSLIVDKYKGRIGLHSDCCLGSFVVPFIPNLPPFDFRVPNVTSISVDTHKYGFGPKGGSAILYRNAEWLKYQYFVDPTWAGGVYGTPTMAGSRNGAIVAATWAVMQYMGMDGYREAAGKIYTKTQELYKALLQDPDIEILGIPQVSVIAFKLKDKNLDVYELKDK